MVIYLKLWVVKTEEYLPNQTQFRLRPIYENGNGTLQLTRAVLLISNTKSKIQPMYCAFRDGARTQGLMVAASSP